MIVPETPAELIGEFLPQYFGRLLSEQRSASSASSKAPQRPLAAAPASVGVGIRVVGAGEWTLRVVAERLLVEPKIANDVALQVSLPDQDFRPLVVEPVRRALALGASAQGAARSVSGGIWSRLGRWDEETVELLRQQTGGILLRIQDGERNRRVALTPSLQPYSLESAECTIDCALADLQQLQEKRGNPLDLFYAGQIRISGDAQIALAMAGLFL